MIREIMEVQRQVNEVQNQRIAQLREGNALLRQKVDVLVKRVLGTRSEKPDGSGQS